jgi:hypothetical protein
MGWLAASIRKYLGRLGAGGRRAAGATQASCQPPRGGHVAKSGRGMPERVSRRPDPAAWSEDELIALHEAVALLWPRGPVTVSTLRTAIAAGELAHARIAGRIYTTRAALAAMAACRRTPSADGGAGSSDETDWDRHLATLLPRRGGRSR